MSATPIDNNLKYNFAQNQQKQLKKSYFPIRYIFVFFGFCALFMLYSLKVNLSVAIVSMIDVRDANNDGSGSGGDNGTLSECIISRELNANTSDIVSNATSHSSNAVFEWNSRGIILSSFFWGFVVTQIPGGLLAKRYGSKIVLGYGIFFTSVFTLLSPVAAKINYILFIICRMFEGMSEGFALPAMHSMIGRWIPKHERGFMGTIIYSGAQIGTVMTMPIVGALCDSSFLGGWPSAFYVTGALGIIWFCFWMLLITDSPHDHHWITVKELKLIGEKRPLKNNHKTPWRSMLTSTPVWALVVAHFGQGWGFLTLLTQLPTYFQTVLGFETRKNGLLSAVPNLIQALVGYIVGYIFDDLIKRNILEVNTTRKLCNTIAFIGSAAGLIGVTMAKCDPVLSVTMFSLSMALNGFQHCGYEVTHIDMSPEFASTLMSLTSCIASLSGFLAPYIAGVLTEKSNSIENWSYVFYISAIIYVFSALIFAFFGSAETQNFNSEKSEKI